MEDFKGTTGPWKICDKDELILLSPSGKEIASFDAEFIPFAECEANARLSKYAPEMLRLLQKIVTDFEISDYREAKILIEKATKVPEI